jgi:beta-glucosidase
MKKKTIRLSGLCAVLLWGLLTPLSAQNIYRGTWIDYNKNGRMDPYEDSTLPVDARVADLLSHMTLEEKTCQLATLYGYGRVLRDSLPTDGWKNEVWKDGIANIDEQLNGVGRGFRTARDLIVPFSRHAEAINTIQRWFVEQTRLGIPVDFSNEGIHGLNHTGATPLPAPIGIGSTWNRALVRRAGEIAGAEARALGYTNVYAPILDLARDPRWGRVVECYSEDPYLIGRLGAEMVAGIQSQGTGSTLKHFAAYSVPKGGRDGNARTDPHIAPRELHEIHLAPFKTVIERAHPLGVMSSYNDWDGVPVTASPYFLTELLRDTYGFDGYVVSDSEAVEFIHDKHRVAATYDEAVRLSLTAGLNVRTHFAPPADFILAARRVAAADPSFVEVIDRRVAEVLSVKFRLGLFERPYVADPAAADRLVGADKNDDFVSRMQAQSFVLLKNEGGLLPLDKAKIGKVLVAGPLADEDNFMTSRYGPNGLETVTVLEGLREVLGDDAVVYAQGCATFDDAWPDSEIIPELLTEREQQDIQSAVRAAEDCEVIVAVLGEDIYGVGESRSRTSLDLPGRQQQLLAALHATGKPVVLVLINGRPLTVNWAQRYIPSILETWHPAYTGGRIIARTLFGEYNPGGKLPVTFPKSVGQIEYNFPFKPGSHGLQGRSGPNGSGHSRVTGALYPFGYGLSYTTFAYSDLQVIPRGEGRYTVRCRIANTGSREGDEVVQLYIQDKYSSVIAYDSVLRGFERVTIPAGESREATFELSPEDFQLLNGGMQWVVEPGEFEIRIGASSEDIRLRETIAID